MGNTWPKTVKQIEYRIKIVDAKMKKLTKEISDLKKMKLKLSSALSKQKAQAPKKRAPSKATSKKRASTRGVAKKKVAPKRTVKKRASTKRTAKK